MRLGNTRLTLAISIAICYGIQLTQAQNYKVIVATDGHEAGNSDDKLYRYDSSGNLELTFDDAVANPVGTHERWTSLRLGPNGGVFATSFRLGNVYWWNPNTGASLGPFTESGFTNNSTDLEFGPDAKLYVTSENRPLARFDDQNGQFIDDDFIDNPAITGHRRGLTFGPNNNLYINAGGQIHEYDGATGASVGTAAGGLSSPFSSHVKWYQGDIYATDTTLHNVFRWDSNGVPKADFVPPNSGGLESPQNFAWTPDGSELLVASSKVTAAGKNAILRYDGTTGAYLGEFATFPDTEWPQGLVICDGTCPSPTFADVVAWKDDSLGDWQNSFNWTSVNSGEIASAPVTNKMTAVFGDAIGSNRTVFTDETTVVNSIQFDNANSYFLAGAGNVDLQANTSAGNPTVQVIQGSHEFQVRVEISDAATVDVAAGSSLDFVNRLDLNGNTLTKTGDGTLLVNNSFNTGSGTIVSNGGVIGGGGVVGGDIDNSGGTVAPGNSPGILTVSGNYTQGASATLAIEVASDSEAGTSHDQLAVTGNASLDGTLDIITDSGFTPGVGASPGDIGDTFVIVTASSRSGQFSTVNGRHVGAGIFYDVQYNSTNVALGAFQAAVGDTDGDRDVDITDFNTLSGNFDPNGNNAPHEWTNANFDGDDDIDITDFNGLSANFAPGGYSASGGQVPEPGTLILLMLGSLIWISRSLRK